MGGAHASYRLLICLCRHHPEKIPVGLIAGIRLRAEKKRAGEEARRLKAERKTLLTIEQALASPGRLRKIVALVCHARKISVADFYSVRRFPHVSQARQLAYYLARELTTCSFPMIGKLLGGRDHTTILHGCRTIEERMSRNEALREEASAIADLFHSGVPSAKEAA